MHAEYDDLFIYLPSMLVEGKSLGTAKAADLSLGQDILKAKDIDPAAFAKERKKGTTVGKRKLEQVQTRVRTKLLELIGEWDSGELYDTELRKGAAKLMKTAWRDVFLAGLRAGGTKGTGAGKGKTLVALSPGDDVWLKSAMQHETRFLNKFMTAIVDETYKMPLPRRVEMYVNALSGFYQSARVISLPESTLIRWTGPHDKKTCASCRWLFDNNPYTKYTLPVTPKSGATICLTNCRDRLTIRRVGLNEARARTKGQIRESLARKLQRIKKTGKA